MHHPSWELGDQLFLTRLLPEPDQVDLRAMTTTSQRLAEGARRSAETQATATPLPTYVVELDVFLEENLYTRRIQPSKSSIAAPVFYIKKKDGLLHLVQDYCMLNAVTIKNRYPLPLISELVSQLRGVRYFTKLDVHWGSIMYASSPEMNGKQPSAPTVASSNPS